VADATNREFTVAAYNFQRFFDTVNDPNTSEPVLTATAFDNRLNKASLAVRNHLKFPDIIGAVEVENLATLQAIAARVNADAVASSQPDPQYQAFLVEGNDVGGIDVGFLVKTAPVNGPTPRVTVGAVVQENAGELFTNPDSSTELLNDRPTLRLNAVVNHPNGASFDVTVLVNHLRSLNGVDDESPGPNGWLTGGARVRAKRRAQAESLANLVQDRQEADPSENIVLVGDFNAFEFNDGLVDSMNTIAGTPTPADQVVLASKDLVDPNLVNLLPPPAERYSFTFDGNAQTLDHVLVNAAMLMATEAQRTEHARIGADFPQTAQNSPAVATRLSDHDPVVAFFQVATFPVELQSFRVE
jgi:predicted extracellular nuclease